MYRCRICGNSDNNCVYNLKEMMFGLKDNFEYFKCNNCDCLQICKIPDDLSRYYPNNYYSFVENRKNLFTEFLRNQRNKSSLGKNNIVGNLLVRLIGPTRFSEWIRIAGVNFEDKILDVGSGSGRLLNYFQKAGFKNLTGIDPFLERDIEINKSLRIFKKDIYNISGKYDFVMLNHVLEHVEDQPKLMKRLREIVKQDKYLLIRIPIVDSYAWSKYQTDWIQLDAPRHFYLHSNRSIKILSENNGFKIEEVLYDSTSFQFWGSEQIEVGIPLMNKKSYSVNPQNQFLVRTKFLVTRLNQRG